MHPTSDEPTRLVLEACFLLSSLGQLVIEVRIELRRYDVQLSLIAYRVAAMSDPESVADGSEL